MENWESYVRKVVPYVPGEQPQAERMIKLNTNENPYPPAPGVQRALAGFNPDTLRLYPEPTCKVLVDAIASYYGLGSDQVFVGVGSDDVLAMIFLTFFNSGKPVFFPDIGQICCAFRMRRKRLMMRLRSGWRIITGKTAE